MSTVTEIQNAILSLPEGERMSLLEWIHTHEEADDLARDPDLLKLADDGASQLDAGLGISLKKARTLTSTWTLK